LAALDRASLPRTHLAFDSLLAEHDGTIWIREHSAGSATVERWSKFDPGGRLVGLLQLPSGWHAVAFGYGKVVLLSEEPSTGLQELDVFEITSLRRDRN
jgi:hypothetical protein